MKSPTQKQTRVIAGFELMTKIGQGGMGAVFKARQISLDRLVAIKILPPKIAKKDPVFVERFIREARVSAKLNHPNIVQGIEVGEASGLYYFAMEYIDGPTIRDMLKKQRVIEERQALKIVRGVADALACAQRAGIVHRDIKPDNILMTSRGEPKLADLGLARRVSDAEEKGFEEDEQAGEADAALTQAGSALGTPHYMAPEQVQGHSDRIDTRTDLYALGATLYHMVTGEPPFHGVSAKEIMRARLTSPPPIAKKVNSKLNPGTSALTEKLMQRESAKRFQTPNELIEELDALIGRLEGGPAIAGRKNRNAQATAGRDRSEERRAERVKTTGISVLPVALGGVVLLVLAAFVFLRGSEAPPKPRETQIATKEQEEPAKPEAGSHPTEAPEPEPVADGVPEPVATQEVPNKKLEEPEVPAHPVTPSDHAEPDKPVNTSNPPARVPEPLQNAGVEASSKAEYGPGVQALWTALDPLLVRRDTNASLELLKSKNDDLPELVLRAERTHVELIRKLEDLALKGAESLQDGTPFTFKFEAKPPEAVGGESHQKFVRVRERLIEIERRIEKAAMTKKFDVGSLEVGTLRTLAERGAGDDASLLNTVKAGMAILDVARAGTKKDRGSLQLANLALASAKAEGVPGELLAGLAPRLDQLGKALDQTELEEQARKEEAKRKAEEEARKAALARVESPAEPQPETVQQDAIFRRDASTRRLIDRAVRDVKNGQTHLGALRNSAFGLGTFGEFEESLKYCNLGVEKFPNQNDFVEYRGHAHHGLGKFAAATADYRHVRLKGGGNRPYFMLWEVACASKLSEQMGQMALAELKATCQEYASDNWISKPLQFFAGRITEEQLLTLMEKGAPQTVREQRCEGFYYLGVWHRIQGDREKAQACFRKSIENDVSSFFEPLFAKKELEWMEGKALPVGGVKQAEAPPERKKWTPPQSEDLFPEVPRKPPSHHRAYQNAKDDKLAKLKPGDWVEFKDTRPDMGLIRTFKERDGNNYTFNVVMYNKLGKDYVKDETRTLYHPTFNNKVVREGKQTIKVGGKEYECTWYELVIGRWQEGEPGRCSYAIEWFCPDAPWNGIVKSVYCSPGVTMESYLHAYGTKENAPE